MSILATIPHAVPSLPIGLMPIAASPIAPVGAGEPFGFCEVITELETPLQPAMPVAPGLPPTGTSLPAPMPVDGADAPPAIEVAEVMIGTKPPMVQPPLAQQPLAQQPVVRPGIAPAPSPALLKPILSSQPAPIAVEPEPTEAEPDIQTIPAPPTAVAPAVRRWVLGSSSALTVARALPSLPKAERGSLPEKISKDDAPAPIAPAVPIILPDSVPAVPVPAPAEVSVPTPPPAFAPVSWVPLQDDAARREKTDNAAAGTPAPVVLFPTVARPIARLPADDRGAVPVDIPVAASAHTPAASSLIAPIEPVIAEARPPLPTPVAARPIEAIPTQLPPELTRQIAQLLPPRAREPVEPAALAPAEPSIFPVNAPAPIQASTPQPIIASQPAPVDTARGAWMDAMIERIAEMPQVDGKREAVIRLLPDQLGAVEVTVTERGDRLHVTMNAESAQARQMLSEAAPRLHDLAEARGLRFAQADIGGGQPQDRRPAGQQQPQDAPRPRSAATAGTETNSTDGDLIA